MKSIDQLSAEVAQVNIQKGWRPNDNTFGDDIALLHSEASEALDAYRVRKLEEHTDETGKPDDVGSEFADVLIRLLDICDRRGIDLYMEYERKIEYNRRRSFRHGGKFL